MRSRIEFRVLGPLEVLADGEAVSIGGSRQRALLAILLLNANRVVSRERLIEELVDGGRDADHALRVQVSRLRKALGPGNGDSRLVTRAPGYLLHVEPGELDLHRFEELVAEGRQAIDADSPERAARLLRDADLLWRGRALADLEFEPFARVDIERLEESRIAALEERIDAELALGRHGALVPELEKLVADHPLRERLRAQLMLALYRSGRQADALAAYRSVRELLDEELALDPSPQLKDLEQAILRQDDALELPRAARVAVAVAAPAAPSPHESPSREGARAPVRLPRRWVAVAAAVLAAGATVAGILAAGRGSARPAGAAIHPGAVAFLDSRTGRLVGQVAAGPSVGTIHAGAGAIWDLEESGIMLKIDPRTLRLVRQFPVTPTIGDFAVAKNAVWMVDTASSTLLRADPTYGRIVDRIRLPRASKPGIGAISSAGVALGAGSVWVAYGLAHVERVNPVTDRIEHSFAFDDASGIAFGDRAAWVVASDLGTVTKIDPATNKPVATARIPPWICCPAVGGGYFWASNAERIWKVSPTGEVVATYDTPSQTGNIAFGDGALWVANDVAGSVLRIDPETDTVKTYRVGHVLTGIGVSGHLVALSVRPNGADVLAGVTGKVFEIRMGQDWIGSADPAVGAAPGTNEWPWLQQLFHATCAGLLSYPDAPAPRGWRLVPEVAAAPPAVSPDGRTYTFAVRRGFRLSPPSNEPVTAETFKYTIERALSPKLGSNAPALGVAADIVGVQAYRAGRAKHIAGVTARGNVLRITLRRPSADFSERIASSFFCPVPIGTPAVPNGLQDSGIPSAGPYYLRGFGGDVAVLKRNPNYGGSRPHRLDAIVYRLQPRTGAAATAVADGKADYIAEPAAALAPTTALARRYGGGERGRRYFRMPVLATDELVFETRQRPFSDRRLRRAVNFALDRPRLAAVLGDLVTDRYLPPGTPGYRDRHVYSLSRPDLRRARALTPGSSRRAVLAMCSLPACHEVGRIVRANLRRIGLLVALRSYAGAIGSQLSRHGADIVLARVFSPYPDPVAALQAAVGARADVVALARLGRTKRLAAADRLDIELLHGDAPAAAFGTPSIPELFSDRVGCKTFQPLFFGVDLASLCLSGAGRR